MRKIILVGTVPPPYTGQSVAFQVLTDYMTANNLPFKIINISESFTSSYKPWRVIVRSLDYIIILMRLSIHCLFSKNLVYVQVSQSKNGFRRDVWINRISKLFGSKIIGHLHGGNFRGFYEAQNAWTKKNIKKELLSYSKIVVLSDNLKSMYDFQPLIHERLVCIPNGIDKATTSSAKNLHPCNRIQILYLSTLMETKGYLIVLESLHLLKQLNIPFEASFCGQFDVTSDKSDFSSLDKARNNFFAKIKEYDLENEVNYKGIVTGIEKEGLLGAAHFFILPTQYINEGQPVSIIEAMRSGCVVISSNYRAIPEMIQQKKSGFLLDEISPKNIAGCIISCINDPGLFSRISKHAIETYNSNFTEDRYGQRITTLLQECGKDN